MQANTIPATFWALAFLLLPDNQDHKQHILLALQSTHLQAKHTSVPDAPTQQQTSPDGRLSAAVGSSEASAAGMAAAATGSGAAAHTKVPVLIAPETATSVTAAPVSDTQTAPTDARGPYSEDCLSWVWLSWHLCEQCGAVCMVNIMTARGVAARDVLTCIEQMPANLQLLSRLMLQIHVVFVRAHVASIHTHFMLCYYAILTNAPSPCCCLQLCWLIQTCCHILACEKPYWAFLITCYNPPTALNLDMLQLLDRWHAGNDRLVTEACDRSSLLAGCVAEAVRVRAPGVAVRMATCDLAMPLTPGKSVHISKVRQVLLRK